MVKLRGKRHKGQNRGIQSNQLSWTGQYKKGVQYSPINLVGQDSTKRVYSTILSFLQPKVTVLINVALIILMAIDQDGN